MSVLPYCGLLQIFRGHAVLKVMILYIHACTYTVQTGTEQQEEIMYVYTYVYPLPLTTPTCRLTVLHFSCSTSHSPCAFHKFCFSRTSVCISSRSSNLVTSTYSSIGARMDTAVIKAAHNNLCTPAYRYSIQGNTCWRQCTPLVSKTSPLLSPEKV